METKFRIGQVVRVINPKDIYYNRLGKISSISVLAKNIIEVTIDNYSIDFSPSELEVVNNTFNPESFKEYISRYTREEKNKMIEILLSELNPVIV